MKRILYLSHLNPNKCGSIEDQALFLHRELTIRGHHVIFTFIGEPTASLRKNFEAEGAHIIIFNLLGGPFFSKPISKILGIFWLRRVIHENRIDIVHLNFAGLTDPAIFGIYSTCAKIVYTEHSSGLPFHRSTIRQIFSKIIHFFISRRISVYIGVSNYVSLRLKKTHHIPGSKVITLYNGVDLERFKPRSAYSARIQLGLPFDRKIVCSVGMLIPEKGIQYLLNAAAILMNQHEVKDVFFLIVGEGYYREELEKRLVKMLKIEEHVLFFGMRNDIETIISAADIVVVPSIWDEAFGLVIAEAMASARPVVASNVGGIPELVENAITGLLVKRSDCLSLSDAIFSLLTESEEGKGMGQAGRAKSEKEFDLNCHVRKLADIYESL